VFIGINDVWHGLVPGRDGCPIDRYVAGYRDVLGQTTARLPSVRLVLCEPSVLWLTEPADANDRLAPYVSAVHELAREFAAAAVVPLHGAFEQARAARPDIPWTTDGVHPTSYGHTLIAREWLRATGLS
jgi:lysophospholipase L1-like esterase